METLQHNTEEVAEIEKHKYFMSEKAGHDVGWEAAEQDWLANHANQFRGRAGADSDLVAASRVDTGSGIRIYLKRLFVKAGKR